MPSEVKVAAVEQLTQVLEGAKSIYLTDFTGMPVEMMASLRRRCRESQVEYRVVKDTLTKLAAKRAGVEAVIEYIEGPTGLAIGRADELAPARVLTDFAKEHKLPRIKAALVEGRMFTEEGVKTLAVLPSREVLLGQFVSGLMAPLGGLRGALHQLLWKLVATLQAVAECKEDEGASPAAAAAGEPQDAGSDISGAEGGSETAVDEGVSAGSSEAKGADAGPGEQDPGEGGEEETGKATEEGGAGKGSQEGDA